MKMTGYSRLDKLMVKIGLFIVLLIISSSGVSAFGVSTPFWDTHPLTMMPGETFRTEINLQNKAPGDSDDLTVNVELSSTNNIASIITGQTIYDLPYGTDENVEIEITMPEDVEIGDEFGVQLRARSAPRAEAERGVTMNLAAVVSFPVMVVEATNREPISGKVVREEESSSFIGFGSSILIIAILIIAVIIFSMVRNKQGTKKRKKKR